ncbi:OmpA family protein [Croceicoccus mobilis]|uniref:OmpA-like domain-containing protein n=1 Tax=Croceicoccus mobilis TaxID=1703339 RepID=A0A916YYI4_9SPHN|nr:OmpA family protein [Croceicoccus mobilis]GGD66678.1 hypothetical protein GCM10010990_15260 [Croceicoccus mobilis]
MTIAGLALALAACDQNGTTPAEPEDDPAAQVMPEEEEVEAPPVNSILRDDMPERPIEKPPLMPLEVTISYPDGGSELDEAAKEAIANLTASEQFAGDGAIVLRGHTDSEGNDEANIRASRKRAEAVAEMLEEAGASSDRIKIIPMGEQNPIEPNALPDGTPNEEGRAANRRVEITVEPPSDDTGESAPPAAAPEETAQADAQAND